MILRQISVFVENKSGRMLRVTRVLADAGVDLRALCVADTQDFGILRCVVSDTDAACVALDQAGIMYNQSDVIGVIVPDEPHGMEHVLQILEDGAIDVEYLYSYAALDGGRAVVIFKVSSPQKAIELLQDHGCHLISHHDLAKKPQDQ